MLSIIIQNINNLGRPTWVRQQQLQEQSYPVLHVHARSFHVSVIHWTLTWSKGSLSLTNVCKHTGVGHTDDESAQHFQLRKTLTIFSHAPDGVRTMGLRILSPSLYQLSHPVTPVLIPMACQVCTLHELCGSVDKCRERWILNNSLAMGLV